MAKYFDPRKVLRQIAKPLLRQFFARHGQLLDLPWDQLQQRNNVETIFHAWQQLPEEPRQAIQLTLHDIVELSEDWGVRAFAEQVRAKAPEREWMFQACQTRINKVMWFHLNFPELFEEAALFARADALSSGRYAVRRNGLPKTPLQVSPEMTKSLETALKQYYWPSEMRGMHCRIAHYSRPGGSEYFFAYLDDWPHERLMFDAEGNLLSKLGRYAFNVLLVACPTDGALEVVVKGGPDIQYAMQRAFCQAVYGLDVEPASPLRPSYCLQRVLDPNFTYPTDPADGIGRVRLAHIGLVPRRQEKDLTYLELAFGPDVTRQSWLQMIFQQIDASDFSRSEAVVQQISLQLFFVKNGWERDGTMTFNIALPSLCDLKDKPDNVRVIGERCVRLWEFCRG